MIKLLQHYKFKRAQAYLADFTLVFIIYYTLGKMNFLDFKTYETLMSAARSASVYQENVALLNQAIRAFGLLYRNFIISLVFYNVFFVLFFKGQTIGKRIFRLQLISVKSSKILGYVSFVLKEILKGFSLIFLQGVPFFFAVMYFIYHREGRSSFDDWMKTRVIEHARV